MCKLICVLLCLFYVFADLCAQKALFIVPCKGDDKDCLKSSTQKAISFFADGLPQFEMNPLDPAHLQTIPANEGSLNLIFKGVIFSGFRHCQVLDVERNLEENSVIFKTECPINVLGQYTASGDLYSLPIEGDGLFYIKADKMAFTLKIYLETVDGEDGQKYLKPINKEQQFYAIDKPVLKFDNLFNGDQEKAAPVLEILDKNCKQVVPHLSKFIVDALSDRIIIELKKFMAAVPANELVL